MIRVLFRRKRLCGIAFQPPKSLLQVTWLFCGFLCPRSAMASESSPLLAYRLLGEEGAAFPPNGAGGSGVASARKLSTFLGVVVPTVLSMFSIVVFLRIGESGDRPGSG